MIKILLADDHKMVREGLRLMLANEPDFDVVGEADSGRIAVKLTTDLAPDIVVMDVQMSDLNGIDATRQVLSQREGVKVIGLTGHFDPGLAAEMLRAGAAAYVLKDAAVEELTRAIRAVMKNEVYLSPAMLGLVVADYVRTDPSARASAFTDLSPREREVLQQVAAGKSTKQAAIHLHVSVKTVETHRRNLMHKLNVDNVADLTKYAIRQGLSTL
ncbi:MAG TPA: response regulator transcription factor [Tepidisphaeraceae bacterium]